MKVRVHSRWRRYDSTKSRRDLISYPDGFIPPELLPAGLPSDKPACTEIDEPPFELIDAVLDEIAKSSEVEECGVVKDKNFLSLVRQVSDRQHLWRHEYSPRTRLFLDIMRELTVPGWSREDLQFRPSSVELTSCDALQQLVKRLQQSLSTAQFRREERNWRGQVRRREASVNRYVNALIKKHSKLLVLRLDFYPRRLSNRDCDELIEGSKRWKETDFDDVVRDVERLLNNRRSNTIFAAWLGYVVKFEFAPSRGYHAHAIIFLDGHKVDNDGFYGMKYSRYWIENITNGEGTCFCANKASNKRKYRFVGIGMLDHRDFQMRQNLGLVIRYLCKSDLYLTTKRCVGQKLLRKGRLEPTPDGRRRGRPRSVDTSARSTGQ